MFYKVGLRKVVVKFQCRWIGGIAWSGGIVLLNKLSIKNQLVLHANALKNGLKLIIDWRFLPERASDGVVDPDQSVK